MSLETILKKIKALEARVEALENPPEAAGPGNDPDGTNQDAND